MYLPEKEIEQSKAYLLKKIEPDLLYLFGSAAKGSLRSDSDVDLAFLSSKSFNSYEIFMIAQGLASLIDRDVHLIDLQTASTVFQAQIVSQGNVLYCADEALRMRFEMVTLKKYAKLNEERSPILRKIQERAGYHAK